MRLVVSVCMSCPLSVSIHFLQSFIFHIVVIVFFLEFCQLFNDPFYLSRQQPQSEKQQTGGWAATDVVEALRCLGWRHVEGVWVKQPSDWLEAAQLLPLLLAL